MNIWQHLAMMGGYFRLVCLVHSDNDTDVFDEYTVDSRIFYIYHRMINFVGETVFPIRAKRI